MMNFLSEYPLVKWILIGFGVLYLLDKYLGFSPIDKLINRVGSYKFKMFSHLNDEKLKQLIEDFNQNRFEIVDYALKTMTPSYRSFAFKCLGQYGKIKISDEWLNSDFNNAIPKIIKAYQLIDKGWKIRGRGYIDSVSEEDLKAFKDHLKQAESLLLNINDKSNDFQLNIASSLLKIYRSIDVERATINQLFQDTELLNPNDAELNFNYFSAISAKWGGTEEELNSYFNTLNSRSAFIQNLIQAQYFLDLVHMEDNKDEDGKIKNFVYQLQNIKSDDQELYKHELNLLLYWIANNLKLKDLEKHYKSLVEPFWED